MTRACFQPLTFLFAMSMASAAFAGDIVKCVDSAGRVTLTDSPCPENMQTLPGLNVRGRNGIVMERVRVAALPPVLTHEAPTPKRPAKRMLARDVSTLRAARLSMDALDQGSQALRAKLAGLN